MDQEMTPSERATEVVDLYCYMRGTGTATDERLRQDIELAIILAINEARENEMERRGGHSKLVWDDGSLKTIDPNPPLQHSHKFEEVISHEDGITRRCQCGARLWEPDAALFQS